MEKSNCNNRENTDKESEENLLGVFSILLVVAKRTNPEKYLKGYKANL